jgi:hypothetical protein
MDDIKIDLKETGGCGLDSSGSTVNTVIKFSGSGRYLAEQLLASLEGLYSMDLVRSVLIITTSN